MKILLLFSFCCLITTGFAQKTNATNIGGCWRGKITQNQGGIRPEYMMELYLAQKGTKVIGRSFVYFDKVYAEMQLEGEFKDGVLVFKESKLLAYKKLEGMEWCMKGAILNLIKSGNPWKLEGAWTGNTSFGPCIPGKIYLKKSIPRA